MKNGKASGADSIYPEFLTYAGPRARMWLANFYSNIVALNKLPAAFKITKIIALLKHGKKDDKPENYRPIALLSTSLKLLERLLFNRIGPQIEKVVLKEQAGFRKGRSCDEQVLSLTNFIESGFQQKLKTGAVFIDLTAAYDTIWKKGLMYKLVKAVPCLQICDLICNMLSERLFQVLINDEKSRLRKLNNGLPQVSVLSPMLFNLYVHDLPPSTSRKFLYADDMAYAAQHKCFHAINQILTNDMEGFVTYCKRWRLIPNKTKTIVTCFHLNNQAANHKLEVLFDGKILEHDREPSYLGVKMNRSLTFNQHARKVAGKLRTRNNLLQKLANSSWGASAVCLRTTALALVYSSAEYCCAAWLNSSHVNKVDNELNRAMRLINGNVASTPLPWLSAISKILPPDIRRKKSLLRVYRKVVDNADIPLHEDIQLNQVKRLKSRNPPLETAKMLSETGNGMARILDKHKLCQPAI